MIWKLGKVSYLCYSIIIMKVEVVGFIPKLLYKIFLTLKEKFDPTQPIPEEERITVDICKKLISNPSSKLTFAPVANKRFIRNEEKDMYIVMHSHTINLINHVYSYSIYLSDTNSYNELTEMFDQILDKERLKLEDEIKNNIQHSLESILQKLD